MGAGCQERSQATKGACVSFPHHQRSGTQENINSVSSQTFTLTEERLLLILLNPPMANLTTCLNVGTCSYCEVAHQMDLGLLQRIHVLIKNFRVNKGSPTDSNKVCTPL